MSDSVEFTAEERRFIASYLQGRSRMLDKTLHYGAFISPSVLFALYALWKQDFAAALVAYGALLIVAIVYLNYSGQYADTLRSVLEKYEAAGTPEKTKS